VRMAGENVEADLRANLWRGPLSGGEIVDVMMHVPAAREFNLRDEFVFVIGRYYSEHVVLGLDPEQVGKNETLALFTSHPIGVELDTLPDLYLSSPQTAEGLIAPNVRRYRSFDAAIEGLKSREVAALMGPRAQVELAAEKAGRPISIARPPMPGLGVGAWDLGIGVRADSRDLGYAFADTLTALRKSGELAKIFARYGLSHHADFED
jgi:polar amino acid transport system substrate-binding protein